MIKYKSQHDHHNGVNKYEDRGENPDNNTEPEETSRAPAPHDGTLGQLICDIEEDPFEEHNDRVDEDEDNKNTQVDDNDDSPEPRKRAPRHSCNPGMQVQPTTLAYYNGPWKTVLADSKVHWRRELAIGNAWPSCQDNLHIVRAILEAQILQHKNKGAVLSDEFQVNRNMHILDYIHPILPRFYIEVTPEDYEGNQLAVFNAVIEQVKNMLDSGSFHHGPTKDSLGKTNNFAHPCIGHIIQHFFYNKADGMARSFQDDFSEEVPLNVIALVATAIVGCIEEYLATGKQRNLTFDAKGYMGTYNNMVKSVERVHSDPYHGKKLTKLRCVWAAGGMAMLNPVEETFGRDIPVDLN
ncbi:hypothetical protein BJ165DRAFT_1534901 [Panaeolus papilionaceus]|nr:hypothetical protein BJ165DRAFT_1534901 [Panaeolus papilionaceus]